MDDFTLERRFTHLECAIATLTLQGVTLMAQNQQIIQFLDKLDTYTNDMANAQTVQTAKLTEIAEDIDRLVAETELAPELADRLASAADNLQAIAAFETAQAETLTNIAAKSEVPLPPPAIPPAQPAPPIGG